MQTVRVVQRLPIKRMMNRPITSIIWYTQFLLPLVTVSKYLLAVPPFLVSNTGNLPIHVNSYNCYNSLLDSISVSNLLLPCWFFFLVLLSCLLFLYHSSFLLNLLRLFFILHIYTCFGIFLRFLCFLSALHSSAQPVP